MCGYGYLVNGCAAYSLRKPIGFVCPDWLHFVILGASRARMVTVRAVRNSRRGAFPASGWIAAGAQ